MKKIIFFNIIFLLISGYIAVYPQQSAKVLYEQGLEAFKSKNYGSAELIFRKVIENDDQYKDSAWYYMAISIFYQKKYKSAVFELNRFLLVCSSAELCNKSRFWIAECYFYQNDFSTAVEEYKRFISLNKKLYPELTKESYLKIGKSYFIQGRYTEAINEWNSALKFTTVKTEIEELNLLIAQAYYSDRNYKSAIQSLNRSIYSKDKSIRYSSLLLQGKVFLEQKSYQDALDVLNRIDKDALSDESFISAFYYKALCFEGIKDFSNAMVNYDNYIKLAQRGNDYFDARYRRAILNRSKNPDESLAEMRVIYNETNNNTLKQKVAIELALFEYENNNKANALNYLNNISIELNDSNKETYIKLGEVYIEIKEYSQAEKIFSDILEKYKFDKDADRYQFLYSLVFLSKGDYVNASKNFEKIREFNPFSIYINEAVYYTAKAEFENRNYQKSANLLNQYLAIRSVDNRFEATKLQHLAYINLDDSAHANSVIAVLIKSYLRSEDISKNLYNHVIFLKKRKQKYLYYENILTNNYQRSKYTALLIKERADDAFAAGKYRTAEMNYTTYLSIVGNNSDPDSFVNKARSIYLQKNYEKTIYYLQNEVLSVYNADAYFNILLLLSRSYYKTEDFEKSYEYFVQIRDQKLSNEDLFLLLDLYIKKKLLSKAVEILPQLESDKQYYPEALYMIAMYHKEYLEYDDALAYLDIIQEKFPQSYYEDLALYEKADMNYRSEKYEDAEKNIASVKTPKLKSKKEILLSLIYLKTERLKEASVIVDRNIVSLVKLPEGEVLLKSLVEYSYDIKNIGMINKYSLYLVKNYQGNAAFTDFIKAKYYYDAKNYQRSYNYYQNLVKTDAPYSNESFYYLGEISLYIFRKNYQAIEMYSKVTSDSNELYMKSRITLAMLYYEAGKREDCLAILNELRKLDKSIKYRKQAENLYEQYSFNTES